MSRHILALDIGTQSVRAAVVDVDLNILAISQIQQDVDSPLPGWAQQKPDEWWQNVCAAVRDALERTGIAPASIATVSTCGQMHGPVGLDERGQVTTETVQLWCDKRCNTQCRELRDSRDGAALSAIAANPINPAWTGLKVLWIKQTQPEVYRQTRWFLVPKDFVNFRLTGAVATDPSEASGSFLWDAAREDYSSRLSSALGLELDTFAPVADSDAVIGTVSENASKSTGIPAGTPVVAGGGDFPVSLLGFGIVGSGTAADVTGTSAILALNSPSPIIHPAVQNLRHVAGRWIAFTLLDCGGLSMKWCREFIASTGTQDVTFETLIDMARNVPEGSEGLVFYPYMLGERRAENSDARGAFVGLTLSHKAPHLVRAVMEGVALAMGKDAELMRSLGVDVGRLRCVGGGSRNDLWRQIKADILGLPIELSEEPEAGIRGAALLGASGAGLVTDLVGSALRNSRSGGVIEPTASGSLRYKHSLSEFQAIYEHMLGFWQRGSCIRQQESVDEATR